MNGYLGEEIVSNIIGTPFVNYTAADWAMYFVEHYGQYDGSHHKQWVLDQVARILKGTPVIIKKAKWDNGYFEFRVSTGDPSREYKEWVLLMKSGRCSYNDPEVEGFAIGEGPEEYDYDEGIAP